jgi:glycosyltransferase involved in cell wall biosynthesis
MTHRHAPQLTFVCTARRSYTRNETLLAALRRSYRVRAVASDAATYPRRLLAVGPKVIGPIVTADVLVAGFLAQPLAPLLRLRGRSRPVIVDAFISLYETLCEDRRSVGRRSPLASLARLLDEMALRRADRVLTDTVANARHLARRFDVDLDKFAAVCVGANERLFGPGPAAIDHTGFHVFSYATFLPLHGIDVVVRAAHLLASQPDIHVYLVGDGPERPDAERLATRLGVTNLTFHDPVPYRALPDLIAAADVCLGGHFNATNAKAGRVVPGKVFQFLAMGKPVIAGNGPGNREALRPGEDALFVPMGDPHALAEAVVRLRDDPALRRHIAEHGLRRFRTDFSLDAIALKLRGVVDSLRTGGAEYEAAA